MWEGYPISPPSQPSLLSLIQRPPPPKLRQQPEVLALKHESRIFGQGSNPVSGPRKSQASSPCAIQQSLTCSIMEKPHTGLMDFRESYSHALEQGPLATTQTVDIYLNCLAASNKPLLLFSLRCSQSLAHCPMNYYRPAHRSVSQSGALHKKANCRLLGSKTRTFLVYNAAGEDGGRGQIARIAHRVNPCFTPP